VLEWEKVTGRAELLALRTRQLMGRDEDLEEVRLQKQRKRMEGKESFDRTRQIRQTEIKEGDLVLKHNSITEVDMSRNRKLSYKWLGPYRVRKAIPEKGTYILEEFDGTQLAGTYSGNRLKKFVVRNRFYGPVTDEEVENEDSDSPEESESSENEELLLQTGAPIRRSARIQQNAQRQVEVDTPMPDAPRPGRLVIVPPMLTEEQRREYVRFEEDDDGNLL